MSFTLPGSGKMLEVSGEAAWQNPGGQIGIRFANPSVDFAHELRAWLNRNSPESEKDDPPVRSKLTDLSLGGCYLEINSPFPVRTRIVLSMRVSELELRVEGMVCVMHPEMGMGVVFTQKTAEQRSHVERFIHALLGAGDVLPELLVEPEGFEGGPLDSMITTSDVEDPLLDLFQQRASLPADLFLNELRKQRRSHLDSTEETILPI